MKKRLFKCMSFVGLVLGTVACTDDRYDLDNMSTDVYLDYEVYLPVARSTITISDILKQIDQDKVFEKEDGLLSFVYDTLVRTKIDPFALKLAKGSFSQKVDLPKVEVSEEVPNIDDYLWILDEKVNLDELIPEELLEDHDKMIEELEKNDIHLEDYGIDPATFDPKSMDEEDFEDLAKKIKEKFLLGGLKTTYADFTIPKGTIIDYPVPVAINLELEDGEARIDSIAINKAELVMKMTSQNLNNIQNKVNITMYDTKECVKGGILSRFRWNPSKAEARLNLDNSVLVLPDNDTLDLHLKLEVAEDITVKLDGKKKKIEIKTSEIEIKYNALYGAFVANEPQTEKVKLGLDIFDQEDVKFDLSIMDPRIHLEIFSNAGIPIDGKLSNLRSKNKQGNVVTGTFRDGKDYLDLHIQNATKDNAYVKALEETFDRNNGSIDKIFNNHPDSLLLSCSYRINGDVNSKTSFYLKDTIYIDTKIQAEIPFWIGSNSYVEISDTIDGIDLLEDLENYQKQDFTVELAEVFLEIDNGLPFGGEVTAHFLHKDSMRVGDKYKYVYFEIDSEGLNQKIDLKPADVDPATSLVSNLIPTKMNFKIVDAQIEDLKKVNNIALTYKISTSQTGQSVKLTGDCKLSARVYAHAKAAIDMKE